MHFLLLAAVLFLLARPAFTDGRKFELAAGESVAINNSVSSSFIGDFGVSSDSECLVRCHLRGCAVSEFNSTAGSCRLAVLNDISVGRLELDGNVTRQFGSPSNAAVRTWKLADFDLKVLQQIEQFMTARNMTHKRFYIPDNSAKIFSAWLQPQSAVLSIFACVARCREVPTCRGILFNSSSCSLLTDYPLCRWFQQPPSSSHLVIFELYVPANQQCFETVNLRVSDQLSFDRLWAEYKAGFGTYHDNYFRGLEWLHVRTSAQPSSNRLRVDLLYWNDTYVFAYYVNVLILAESTNYTVANLTFLPGNGLIDCLLFYSGLQFQTRDRGWSNCSTKCAAAYQPHWHGCCHCSGPFGKYFNYPTALNVNPADRAKGIVWSPNAPSNISDGWFYSFKQLELLMLT